MQTTVGSSLPCYMMATLPQTSSLDIQVIQGQAGTRLVHGMVGDGDACSKKKHKIVAILAQDRKCYPSPSLPGPSSQWEEFPSL